MIGKQLKALRQYKNISQTELSEILGVVRSQVSMYESDERDPSPEVLLKIIKYFECSIDYLFGVTKDTTETNGHINDIIGYATKSEVNANALRAYIQFLQSQSNKS